MNSNLIQLLVILIFIQKCCESSPVYTFEVNKDYGNNINDNNRLYKDLRTRSQPNRNSIDNSLNKFRAESKKKSCGQILIETLPMICQHSAYLFNTDSNYEYSDSYEDYEASKPKLKSDIIEECCVNKCSFQDLINFCQR